MEFGRRVVMMKTNLRWDWVARGNREITLLLSTSSREEWWEPRELLRKKVMTRRRRWRPRVTLTPTVTMNIRVVTSRLEVWAAPAGTMWDVYRVRDRLQG